MGSPVRPLESGLTHRQEFAEIREVDVVHLGRNQPAGVVNMIGIGGENGW
jgi:hypothetical protein